ncbi:MAG: LPS export ABC transporter periplasmic protein LptC [Candidatus Aminicenantes bacterium]|nr:LPS export ABC transporter periplasmic protein LptC [Candidatus Aminicenantes bacterium]
MKLPRVNKKLLFTFSTVMVLFLSLLSMFLLQTKKGDDSAKTVDTEIEGVNLTYLTFNKNNEKKLEIKCLESQKKGDDKLFMKKITATIFKADKLNKDIHISADSGYAKNDFNDFYLQGNALISSPSFTLSSKSFDLKDLNVLSTQDEVDFKLRDVTGQAKNGLLYIFKNKYLKLFRPKGVLRRAGKPYDFQAQVLRIVDNQKIIHLDKDAIIEGEGTTIKGNRISLQFDQDFANLEWTAAFGNCYFQSTEIGANGRQQSKEITANQIKMLNDPQGRLQKIAILGDGKISLVDNSNSSLIQSGHIKISFNSETQILETIRALARGTLSIRGQDNLTVSGDSFLANYSSGGELSEIHAEKKCEFLTDDFSGTAGRLDYNVANSRIEISGKDTAITSKKNIFESSQFLIQTKLRQLGSDQGVKATLIPEKKNILLRAKPVFVTASGMEMSENGDVINFKGKVKLFQDDIELQAGELLFETKSNRISCRGNADLKFISDNEKIVLHGKTMVFHADELKIVLEGDARLQQAENMLSARKIELDFNRDDQLENITAADQAAFSKKDLSGKAQFLNWFYPRKIILFKNSAEIIKKNAGTIRGQELTFDLSNNEISVSSADDRSETVIRQKMP